MIDLPELKDCELSLDGGVALLQFNRHDVRNELTGTAIAREIITVCEWANANPQVGALVLTGNGTAFSAGGNIHDMHRRKGMFGGTPIEIQNGYRQGIQRMALAMNALEVPAIAAVNGAAIGADDFPSQGSSSRRWPRLSASCGLALLLERPGPYVELVATKVMPKS